VFRVRINDPLAISVETRSPRETLSRDCDSPENQVECNIKRKKYTSGTPSDLSPRFRNLFSLSCRIRSLVQTRFFMVTRYWNCAKSQISILGARTVMHYQCYTLCLLKHPFAFCVTVEEGPNRDGPTFHASDQWLAISAESRNYRGTSVICSHQKEMDYKYEYSSSAQIWWNRMSIL